MKKAIIFESEFHSPNSPVIQRVISYNDELVKLGYKVLLLGFPKKWEDVFKLIKLIYFDDYRVLIISCPSFSNMKYLLFPFCHKILDIRDGWSIAIKNGYGGIKPPSMIKYKVASIIEAISMCLASEVVTVTQGLKNHLDKLTFKKCTLIENGYVGDLFEINSERHSEKSTVIAVCAGKFSEYGKNNALDTIEKLLSGYNLCIQTIEIHIIGCNQDENTWLNEYLNTHYLGKVKLFLHKRMTKDDLEQFLIKSHVGLVVLRNDQYEYGTKVFDYIKFGLDIVGNFDKNSGFGQYFSNYIADKNVRHLYSRKYRMERSLHKVLK